MTLKMIGDIIIRMKKVKVREMIRVGEARKLCSVSRQTVYNYIHSGEVSIDQEAYDKYGVVLVDKDEVLTAYKKRADMRELRRAKNPGRKKSKQDGEIIGRLAEAV